MCGIAGFYNFGDARDRRDMHETGVAMHRAIAHRGPDSADVWQDPESPMVLAHRRLAIVDLSPDGAQPMASASGRYMVAYNGEIYNYRDLQKELISEGYVFKTRSDTEVLLAGIDIWGLSRTLQKLNGMFAIALWDRAQKKIHFIRDRFGKKPLYVGWAGKNLVFASELKALHAHPDFVADMNRNILAQYMRFGYVCAPNAIFKNVWQMLPASVLTIDCNTQNVGVDLSKRMDVYWSLRRVVEDGLQNPVQCSEEQIIHDFEDRLSLATQRRMDCDVPFGSFLSGGIDSSLVTAMMQKYSSRPIKTYSIGFVQDGYDESKQAGLIANHLGTDHHDFMVSSQDALNVIPSLPDMYDEPFADSSQIPTHLISKLARGHVTVALTGDGGDEIMGGYQRHTHIPALWNRIGWIPRAVRQTFGHLMLKVPQRNYDRLRPSYPQFGRRMHRMAGVVAASDQKEIYTNLLAVWSEKDAVVLGAVAPEVFLDNSSNWPAGLSMAERMMFADLSSYRTDDLMVKMDRASMAVALEARAPLMDHELCEYSWRIPHHLKIRGYEGKWLLRQILEKYVPRALTERPKSGFGVPLHDWLKGPLKSWGDDLLNEDRLKKQNIFNASLVSGRWKDFQSGKAGHANASDLWTALMFQSWHDRWMK
jgi:asparagine synthase (glutamine-hydrolysing)